MTTTQAFYFATKLQVAPDAIVIEDTEAVYNSNGFTCMLDNLVRVKIQVLFMTDSIDKDINVF